MVIDKNKFYVIIEFVNGNIADIFNMRIYSGKFVMLAYNQIKNKEKYTIVEIKV